jgi:hypothetical protein
MEGEREWKKMGGRVRERDIWGEEQAQIYRYR